MLKISTVDNYLGNVETIDKGADFAMVGVLVEDQTFKAHVPLSVVDRLDLWQGVPVHVMFNESDVTFAITGEPVNKVSAENSIPGKIVDVTVGSSADIVTLESESGLRIVSSVIRPAMMNLQLNVGDYAVAMISPSDVKLASENFMPDTE